MNKSRRELQRAIFFIPLLSVFFLTGCPSTVGYKKPISDFQNASSAVTASAAIYVTQLNKTERDAYIDTQVSKAEPIKLSEIEQKQVFSPNQIQARLDALDTLTKYGELLAQLANSDAPERITSNADDLGSSLTKLAKDVDKLDPSTDKTFINAVKPATLIIGEIARYAIERKIQKALNEAILNGETPVIELIRAIRDDLVIAYQRKRTAISGSRVIYIDGYSSEQSKSKPNTEKLRKRGEEIKTVLNVWETFPGSNPSAGLDAMAEAHKALVDYAKSPKNEADLATFIAQMETFVARAKRVGTAVQQLQAANDN